MRIETCVIGTRLRFRPQRTGERRRYAAARIRRPPTVFSSADPSALTRRTGVTGRSQTLSADTAPATGYTIRWNTRPSGVLAAGPEGWLRRALRYRSSLLRRSPCWTGWRPICSAGHTSTVGQAVEAGRCTGVPRAPHGSASPCSPATYGAPRQSIWSLRRSGSFAIHSPPALN